MLVIGRGGRRIFGLEGWWDGGRERRERMGSFFFPLCLGIPFFFFWSGGGVDDWFF